MPRQFPIVEDGRVITDEEGQEFTERAVRSEAVETGASIARDAFIRGCASQVIDVRKGDEFPHSREVKRTSGPGAFARSVSRPIFRRA